MTMKIYVTSSHLPNALAAFLKMEKPSFSSAGTKSAIEGHYKSDFFREAYNSLLFYLKGVSRHLENIHFTCKHCYVKKTCKNGKSSTNCPFQNMGMRCGKTIVQG